MPLLPIIFCISLVLLGNYFMLNLMLAVVFESYCKSEMETDKSIQEDYEMRKSQMIVSGDLTTLKIEQKRPVQQPREESKTNKITPIELDVEKVED